MKTKNFMTAFALSAMFAACSQDTELNETIAKNDFSNIPMVEANFTVNTGVDSRMATGWGWELQDKVGFAWLGGPVGATVNGKAYQNNPLYCIDTDGAFKAEGMFYVGKYFAYMPYTEGEHTIEAINFNVTGQTLTTNSADLAKHAIYISPEVYELEKEVDGKVGTDKLPSGIGKNLPLTIARVSNAATVNLTFANTEGLTDLKVLGVTLGITNDTKKTKHILPASFSYLPKESANVKEWKGHKDLLGIGIKANSGNSINTVYTVGAISATSKEGIAVVDNALSVKMLTMPTYVDVDATNGEITVTVETNYGSVTILGADVIDKIYNDPCITYGQDEEGNSYELATAPIFKEVATTGELNVYVDMSNLYVGTSEVATQEELTAALKTLAVSGYDKEVTITVNPEKANRDNNFVLTDFTLPEGLKAKVTLVADGTKVSKGFVFNGNTVINNYIKLNTAAAVNGTMTVNLLTDDDNNALTTLEGSVITINNEATLVNNGVIINDIITKEKTTTKVAGLYVSNNAKASATGTITNNGAVKWIAGKLPTDQTGLVYAEVIDFATLTAASKAGVTTARFVVSTTFGNNGLNLSAEFNKIKYIEISAPVTINMTANSVTGVATTVEFPSLDATAGKVAVQIQSGGSLTVVSDKKENKIDFGNNVKMSLAKNTAMNLTKVTFDGIATIDNKGTILTNSSELKATITGEGSSSSVN